MKDLLVLAFSSTDDIKVVQYLLFWNVFFKTHILIFLMHIIFCKVFFLITEISDPQYK